VDPLHRCRTHEQAVECTTFSFPVCCYSDRRSSAFFHSLQARVLLDTLPVNFSDCRVTSGHILQVSSMKNVQNRKKASKNCTPTSGRRIFVDILWPSERCVGKLWNAVLLQSQKNLKNRLKFDSFRSDLETYFCHFNPFQLQLYIVISSLGWGCIRFHQCRIIQQRFAKSDSFWNPAMKVRQKTRA